VNSTVLDFYNKNKDCVYTPPKIPHNLNIIESARWLVNHPNFAWIKLNINIDVDVWTKELSAVESYYVTHRNFESNGWQSCCLYGLSTSATENWQKYVATKEDAIFKWTELSGITPTITKFWREEFPVENFQRLRFMKVAAGGYINPHSDAPGNLKGESNEHDSLSGWPINLAIIQPDDCKFVLEGYGVVPFKAGDIFLINIRHNHAVLNFSNVDRIHMIGSCEFGSRAPEIANLIMQSYNYERS